MGISPAAMLPTDVVCCKDGADGRADQVGHRDRWMGRWRTGDLDGFWFANQGAAWTTGGGHRTLDLMVFHGWSPPDEDAA
ncbi:hypothetical protein ACLOJK_038784 [Asimina triloba]